METLSSRRAYTAKARVGAQAEAGMAAVVMAHNPGCPVLEERSGRRSTGTGQSVSGTLYFYIECSAH